MHDIRDVPRDVQDALRSAMRLEGVAPNEFDDLLWIMAQESDGRVNSRNPSSSARGLFQLNRNNYRDNPRGIDSFGNAVEEARGGIRYIRQRYGTAAAARAFWERHTWY